MRSYVEAFVDNKLARARLPPPRTYYTVYASTYSTLYKGNLALGERVFAKELP